MIRAEFFQSGSVHTGFRISGHAGYAGAGKDIVCAAVSSAVQLTVNAADAFGCKFSAVAENDTVKCVISSPDENSSRLLEVLRHHLEAVSDEFPKTIKIITTEV